MDASERKDIMSKTRTIRFLHKNLNTKFFQAMTLWKKNSNMTLKTYGVLVSGGLSLKRKVLEHFYTFFPKIL